MPPGRGFIARTDTSLPGFVTTVVRNVAFGASSVRLNEGILVLRASAFTERRPRGADRYSPKIDGLGWYHRAHAEIGTSAAMPACRWRSVSGLHSDCSFECCRFHGCSAQRHIYVLFDKQGVQHHRSTLLPFYFKQHRSEQRRCGHGAFGREANQMQFRRRPATGLYDPR